MWVPASLQDHRQPRVLIVQATELAAQHGRHMGDDGIQDLVGRLPVNQAVPPV